MGYELINWERKSVSEHSKNTFGVLLKLRQCQYLLYELGFTLQRPKYAFHKADSEEQEKFIEEFNKS
ncbi:MAG: helix-turn-helix domain-containing protein [Promethearchaeota archaeon]